MNARLPSKLYIQGTNRAIRSTKSIPVSSDDFEINLLSASARAADHHNDVVLNMDDPSHAWMRTIAYLQDCVNNEKRHWAAKYENDPEYRFKIDSYVKYRTEVLKLKDDKAPPAKLDPAFHKLGSMLADAFGMIDPATGDWTQAVKDACARAGAEYAYPSVAAFCVSLAPGMLKSTINLLGQAAVGLGAPPTVATLVHNVTGFLSSIAQVPVSIYAAQLNALLQSDGVQLLKMENPEFVPNVLSTKILKEDGTAGELRSLIHVQEDLNDLDWVSNLLDSGTEAELDNAKKFYSGMMDGADGFLLKKLSKVTKFLGELQRNGQELNATEKELLRWHRPVRERVALLCKVSRGRTELPGPDKLKAKRSLEQIKHWELLVNDLDAAHKALEQQRLARRVSTSTSSSGEIEISLSPYLISSELTHVAAHTAEEQRPVVKSKEFQVAHSDRAFEQIQILKYRASNVLTNQGFSRHVRSLINVGTMSGQIVAQIAPQIAKYIAGDLSPASDAWQLAMNLAQAVVYAWLHPRMSGEDYLNKIATQWDIVAMTGTGNFVDETGTVVPSKLDAAVTGPLLTRMSTLASILTFDRSVYTQSIFGWVVDPKTLDDEAADRAELNLPEKNKDGKIVKDEGGNVALKPKSVACTYLSLATEFQNLPSRYHRKRLITELIERLRVRPEVAGSMLRNLDCYEDNEANISSAKNGDVSSLLIRAERTTDEGALLPEAIELLEWFTPKDDEVPLEVELTLPKDQSNEIGEGEEPEKMRLPCTLASLAPEFQKLTTRDERQRFVNELTQQRPLSDEGKAGVKQNLATYEKKHEALPADIARTLKASLLAALRDKAGDQEQDRKLFKLMGEVEKRSEAGALQTAQKLGQQYAWIFAGTGSFLLIRSIFTFAAQALIAQGDIGGAQVAESLATRLLGTKLAGNVAGVLSSLFSLGLNYAYHEYIAVKNLQRQLAGGNLSIVNTPAPSLRKALTQEFLAFLQRPDARVEEVTDYSTLAGRQVPEADRPPKMKFIRQTKLTEATWEQMFSADLSSEPWDTWWGYFDEEHGSLEGKTTDQLAEAIREDLEKLKHYLKQEAVGADVDKRELSDGHPHTKILDDNQPLIPLNEPRSLPLASVSTPGTPRNGFPPLPTTPRNLGSPPQGRNVEWRKLDVVSLGKSNKLTQKVKIRNKASSVMARLPRGESVIDPVQPLTDPSDIQHFNFPQESFNENAPANADTDNAPPIEDAPIAVPQPDGPSPVMQGFQWERLPASEFFLATTANFAYFAREPFGTDAIRAYGMPQDEQSIMHIVADKSPTLAVSNMLQMRLSGNTAWGALASTADFAMFFNEHFSDLTPPWELPIRIADKQFPDLALFSQQMALEHPEQGWSPLTGAGGIYVPENAMQPLQYRGIPPTLIDGAPFAVQYTGLDWDNQPVTTAVMLTWDGTDTYVAVDPKSQMHVPLKVGDANRALHVFMKNAAGDHQIESFNVLHHVRAAMNLELSERVRAVVLGGDDAVGIVATLRTDGRSVADVKEWIGLARDALEAEKTYYLTELNSVGNHSAALKGVKEIDGHLRALESVYAAADYVRLQDIEEQIGH